MLQELRHERNIQVEDLQSQIDLMLEQQYYTEDEIDQLISNVSNAITVLESDVFNNAELIDELEQVLISIEVIEGLNGQKVYYIPDQATLVTLGAYTQSQIDAEKAPSYVLDEEGLYIEFEEVVNKLLDKYFVDYDLFMAELGSELIIQFFTDYTEEEFVARSVLMIEELSHYDFYIIGSSQLMIYTNYEGTSWLKVPMQTMRSTFITMTSDVFIDGLYEIDYFNLGFDEALTKSLYEQYVADKTFDGYVLDYN